MNSLADAFRLGLSSRVANEQLRVQCGKWFPADKLQIDYAYFLWTLANEDELTATTKYLDEAPPSETSQIEVYVARSRNELAAILAPLQEQQRQSACSNTVAEWTNGARNIKTLSQLGTEKFVAYLKSRPLTEMERHTRNAYNGCVKQSFNKKRDYDQADKMCTCIADALSEMPIEEVRSMNEFSRDNDVDAIQTHPSTQEVVKRLAHCGPKNPIN